MGIAGGVKNLDWMFTGTFLAMVAVVPLFGWITSNYPRRKFIPLIYYFFIINIFIFYALLKSDLPSVYVGRVFFIWVSVYNLFVVSVFWSFMADIFNNERAKRLFGFIAAGGTAGALVGPAITGILVIPLGGGNLLLISIALLGISILCVHKLLAWQNNTFGGEYSHQKGDDQVISGSIWSGIKLVFASSYLLGVCILILLYTTLATFLYFQQAEIIEANFADGDQRTAVFAGLHKMAFDWAKDMSLAWMREGVTVADPVSQGLAYTALDKHSERSDPDDTTREQPKFRRGLFDNPSLYRDNSSNENS